jgi:hypothetical protein
MKCFNHSDKEANGACVGCGNFFCDDCFIQIHGKNYCKMCVVEIAGPTISDSTKSDSVKKRSIIEWVAIVCGGIILLVILSAFVSGMISAMSIDNNKYCSEHFPGTVYDPSTKMCEHSPQGSSVTSSLATVITTQEPSQHIYSIGESVTLNNQQVTVLSKKQVKSVPSSIIGTLTPGENSQLLLFNVEIKNTGSDTVHVSESDFVVSDEKGNQFNTLSETNTYYMGWYDDVMPNLKITRSVVFGLPKNISGVKISYNFGSSFSGAKIATWQ